jgi:thiamine biosynthesis lipoprotein
MAASESFLQVMGGSAHLITRDGGGDVLKGAEERLRYLEELWTRFSPDSQVSTLNTRPGDWTVVSDETLALIELSRFGWLLTRGLFDPTGLPALLAAGYRSSRLDETRRTDGVQARSGPLPGCGGIEIENQSVRLPAGVTIDAGGIGKGLAADIVACEMIRDGVPGAMVNIGGDLRVVNSEETHGGWPVDIEDPFREGHPLARLRLTNGGVATSTPRHRRWQSEDGNALHLIDPRTGQPVETDVESVTVVAGEAWLAEVVAKAAVMSGFDAAPDLIDDLGLAGLVISVHGRMLLSTGIVEYML